MMANNNVASNGKNCAPIGLSIRKDLTKWSGKILQVITELNAQGKY